MQALRTTAAAAALAFALPAGGCIGSFASFNKLAGWNRTVSENRVIREAVFVAIAPIYTLTFIADLLVLNTVEWWTNENPILAGGDGTAAAVRVIEHGTQRAVQHFERIGVERRMTAEIYTGARLVRTLTVVQSDPTAAVHVTWRDTDGRSHGVRLAPMETDERE